MTEIEGFHHRLHRASPSFRVDGAFIDASSAGLVFDAGNGAQLADGARSWSTASVHDGVLVAERIEVRRQAPDNQRTPRPRSAQEFELKGTIDSVDARREGVRRARHDGRLRHRDRLRPRRPTDLTTGRTVQVKGTLSSGAGCTPSGSSSTNEAGRPSPSEPTHRRATHVLVVVDDPVQGMLLMLLLERFGVAGRLVPDGEQAVNAVRSGTFTLVLMDYLLPVVDGVAATLAIRRWEREHGRAPVAIVAVTASCTQEQCRRYLESGMDRVLRKPYSVRELGELLRNDMLVTHAGDFARVGKSSNGGSRCRMCWWSMTNGTRRRRWPCSSPAKATRSPRRGRCTTRAARWRCRRPTSCSST
jgi:CheY-like chemotaxis protein